MEDKRQNFEKILEHFQSELSKLRTGRANPVMIEDIKADYYGTPTAIKQLGNISVPEPRQILVTPWDKNALQPIEKAIRDSDLGFNPANEGDKIRIQISPLTEERRKELSKLSGRIAEEARIRIRNIREEGVKELKKQKDAGQITEDDQEKQKEKLQKMVDEYNGKIKEMVEKKEEEIMTI